MKIIYDSTPRKDGFRMPGEFEEHLGTFMIWPERSDNWRENAKYAQKAFSEVANTIAQYEEITMCVSEKEYDNACSMLDEKVKIIEMSSDDAWMRDCGPTFVKNNYGEIRGIDWRFNAWGGETDGLYAHWDKDDKVAVKVCRLEEKDCYKLKNFVLEGGSIHVDGKGTAIVTEACLLSKGRNPEMSKEEIEEILKQYLNLEKVIWLKHGIYNDETNEHVDNACCFAAPGEVLLAWTDDIKDPQYEMSKGSYDILRKETDAKGRKLKIHKLYQPKPVIISKEESMGVKKIEGTYGRNENDRLAASYINHYVLNGAVIMPFFNDPMDYAAKEKLEEVYKGRKVIPIYAREIILGGGNIHCITQQMPK